MSKIWPSGEIKLYNIPQSDILNGRAVAFLPGVDSSGKTERERWFEAYRIATESPVTVVKKKKNPLRVSIDIATVAQANYMSFINPDFDNKIYYCIIKDYDYLNNSVTEIYWEIDWFYTDYYNVQFEKCHMAREGLTVKESHFLNLNPYDVNYCEKMRSQELLSVNSDLEIPHYDLGTIGSNGTYDASTMPAFARGEDGGDVFIEQACQNKYGAGEIPVGNYGPSTQGYTNIKNQYKKYPFRFIGPNNIETDADSWCDTSPIIPCVMFSSIDFSYLDSNFPETRAGNTDSGMTSDWLKDVNETRTYAQYSQGTTSLPSDRFKSLIDTIRRNSKFYVMAFPRNAVSHRMGGGGDHTLIYNTRWTKSPLIGGVPADCRISDWQLNYTNTLYPRPYYMIAAAPFHYDSGSSFTYVNPVQQIIDLLTEWNMSSGILGVYMLSADLLRQAFNKEPFDYGDYTIDNKVQFNTAHQRKLDGYNYGSSPKLLQAPYSYLTIENSDGSSLCDFRYEDMAEEIENVCAEGSFPRQAMRFGILSEVNAGSVRMGVAPVNGKNVLQMTTAPVASLGSTFYACDLQKMVSYDNFPQAPYTTDAYMSFLSGVNSSLAAQSNKNAQLDIQKGLVDVNEREEGSRFIEGIKKAGSTVLHAVETGVGIASLNPLLIAHGGASLAGDVTDLSRGQNSQEKFYLERQQRENQQAMVEDVGKGALTDLKGSVIADMYATSKSAFAMRNYVAGTNGGISATNIYSTGQRLLYVHHRLRPDVLATYDDYFRMYGYTTAKYKVPAIAEYKNYGYADVTDNWNTLTEDKKKTPQWETYDNESVFFTQCAKCYVTGVNQDSRDFIEKLFEGGCRFARPIFPSNS